MKMTKKIFLGAVAVVALALVSCGGLGEGDGKGTKWKKTLTVDATEDAKVTLETPYRRCFVPLSDSKKVSQIDTTVVIKNDESIVANNSVVGLAINTHSTKVGETKDEKDELLDFILIGVRVADGKYYVEKYSGVSKNAMKESMDTDQDNIDKNAIVEYLDGKAASAFYVSEALNIKNEEGYEFNISVTQDVPGTLVISLNDKEVAKYVASEEAGDTFNKAKEAIGQVYMYANAKKGDKVVAHYNSDKEKTVGLFEDAE
ncbi:MAG: hypothetical protein MJ188_03255 [Treponema sp.]|nr:hypothetical protein [Treponema sp.]